VILRWLGLLMVVSLTLAPLAPTLAQAPQGQAATRAAPALDARQAGVLIQTLKAARNHGFAPDAFAVDEAARLIQSPDPSARARGEARLEAAAIAYAQAQHGGRLPANRFPSNWAIRPAAYDARADFAAALAGQRLAGWLADLPPSDKRYARLLTVYARYQDIAGRGGWPVLHAKPALKPGSMGEGVEALRRRLTVEDPSAAPGRVPAGQAAPAQPVYDAALAAAVARAQTRYGLTPDGVAGAATIAALNVPVDQRLAQIRANLERWRWMPRSLPAYRLELNIADASLSLFDGGQPALVMRAIVGQPSKQTPMFEDRVQAVVLNPPWNVPPEIAAKEIWPKIRRNPGYMAREQFVVRSGGGLQQLPGPKCALGTIKFDLSNPFGVYLHDTPARSLFARDDRALSHGCMRLEKPNALAERLLAGDPAWPATRVDMALLSGKTIRVPLQRQAPVYVLYWSVFVDDQGQVQFRRDLYRWDEKLAAML
jgi:murein L,D-transpeptidase YcbB/YkuD